MSKLEKFQKAHENVIVDCPARKRISLLCDPDSFVEIDAFAGTEPGSSGVVCGFGAVSGSPVYVFAQDSTQNSGAVGSVHAAKITKIYDLALKTGAPVIGIYDSHGAKISEGIGALTAYGKILKRANNLSGVVPQIAMILGTCAGTSALLAASADFVIMSEAGELFMAPPALSNDEKGAGSATNASKAGIAHIVCENDEKSCEAAKKLLSALPMNNLSSPTICDYEFPSKEDQITALAQSIDSADVKEIAASICDENSSIEILSEFGNNAYTSIATMSGLACGIVATRPGKLDANSCAKISKLVSVCDSFQIPVVTFVNTRGFEASAKAELCGSVRDMARLAHVYAEATTAKISVITGEAFGAAYVALCSAAGSDYTVAWPCATISVLEPSTTVAFLYSDRITATNSREQVEIDYIENEASAINAAKMQAIDDVIDPVLTRPALLAALDLLSAKRVERNPKKHSNIPL